MQVGEHRPPHNLPKAPGGQDMLQNWPKYPILHSAIVNIQFIQHILILCKEIWLVLYNDMTST